MPAIKNSEPISGFAALPAPPRLRRTSRRDKFGFVPASPRLRRIKLGSFSKSTLVFRPKMASFLLRQGFGGLKIGFDWLCFFHNRRFQAKNGEIWVRFA